jgi:hypothetical protein
MVQNYIFAKIHLQIPLMLVSDTDSYWFMWLGSCIEVILNTVLMCAAVSKIDRTVPPGEFARILEDPSL